MERPIHADNPDSRDTVPVTSRGTVVTLDGLNGTHRNGHDVVSRRGIAQSIATLKHFAFGGEFDPTARYTPPVYFVPAATIVGVEYATRLRICSEEDIFGGVVPVDFVATKSITHPLVDGGHAPAGWSAKFAATVRDCVLRGFTAFTRGDACRGGDLLLQEGPVRIKRSCGIGGGGQWVVENSEALRERVDALDEHELASTGVVLEEHLTDVTTYSVGQVQVADVCASYWGTQRLTRNNHGAEVYGGSDLHCVRGSLETLDRFTLLPAVRRAVAHARVYDRAARECFDGFFASRRNYDVASGLDSRGRPRSGVLEQSWRYGGASGAEMAAINLFKRDAALSAVRASSIEVYGENFEPPGEAIVLFRGIDPHVGFLTKFVVTEAYDDA